MKILTNNKTIKRNAKIGQFSSLASLLILGGGLYISFIYPAQVYVSFLSLLIGFILSQVGIFFGNRWGRRPRIDERLNGALKGLTGDYTLYHFLTPVNHLLIGPAGIWIIEPYYQRGTIVFERGKWKQKGGGLFLGYLKIFAQEGLGRPDLEVTADMDNLTNYLKKSMGQETSIPAVNIAMVFTDDRVDLQAEGAPIPAMKIEQFKKFLRATAKATPFSPVEMKQVLGLFPDSDLD